MRNKAYASVIKVDCKRMNMKQYKFLDNVDEKKQLEDFLTTYAIFDPEVGYFQGFGFLAANLMSVLPPELAFHGFTVIMHVYRLREFFLVIFIKNIEKIISKK